MSSVLRFFKSSALPAVAEANAVYFILSPDGEVVEHYITDRFANVKPVGNTLFVERITDALDLRYATKGYVDDAVETLAEQGVGLDPNFVINGGSF